MNLNKNIIFLSNSKIALVVLNKACNRTNVLYANEIKVNLGNIQAQISSLLTDAANFLGFNIKNVDLVFEDFDISINHINKSFNRCASKEEVIKQIYKEAGYVNKFVNNTIFANDNVDPANGNIICKTLITDYEVYSGFKEMIKHCNVKLDNVLNLATLLNSKNDELVVTIKNDKVYACQYLNDKLVNCVNAEVNFDAIVEKIAKQFNTTKDNVDHLVKLTKILVKNDNYNFNVAWNYDLKNKSLSSINAQEFVKAWRNELVNEITKTVLLNDVKNTVVLANELNNFNSTNIQNDIFGLDGLSDEFVLAINNVDKFANFETQSKYDSQIESEFERINA